MKRHLLLYIGLILSSLLGSISSIGQTPNPSHVSFLANGQGGGFSAPTSVAVSGSYAYIISSSTKMLTIANISTPSAPTRVSSVVDGQYGIKLPSPTVIKVSGIYAFVGNSNGLEIINISNPLSPAHVAFYSVSNLFDVGAIDVSGTNVFILFKTNSNLSNAPTYGSTIEIISISSPTSPQHVGSFSTNNVAIPLEGLIVSGNYAYSVGQSRFYVINVSNPGQPSAIANYPAGSPTYLGSYLAMTGNYVYVATQFGSGIDVVDVSTPNVPTVVGSIANGAGGALLDGTQGLTLAGNYLYATNYNGSVEVLNITNRSVPAHAATITDGIGGAKLSHPAAPVISGSYLFAPSTASDALEILNIGTPGSISHAGSLNKIPGAAFGSLTDIAIAGNYAYVLDLPSHSLQIFDISNPASLVFKGSIVDGANGALLTNPSSIFVTGNYAYVTSNDALEIINISDPTLPVHAGKITNGTNGANLYGAKSVKVVGQYAYIASGYNGAMAGSNALEIVNISTPTIPAHAGTLADGTNGAAMIGASDVFVSGSYAYVISYNSSALEIIDISTPTSPQHAGKLVDAAHLNGDNAVTVVGNYVYTGGAVIDASTKSAPVYLGSSVGGKMSINGYFGFTRAGIWDLSLPLPRLNAQINTNGVSGLGSAIAVGISGSYLYALYQTGIEVNQFLPAPVITAVTPNQGPAGSVITITGNGFSTTPANNIVSIAYANATVTAATATSLTVTVPPCNNGPVNVTSNGLKSADAPKLFASIDFTSMPTLCPGTPVTLGLQRWSSGAISYSVTNGTGTATVSGNVLTPGSVGTITITANVAADANYSAASISKTFTISNPTISVSSVTNTCSSQDYTISYTSTGSPTQYMIDWNTSANNSGVWDIAWTTLLPGLIRPNANQTLTVLAGTYNGIISVRNAAGCVSPGTPISLTVTQAPFFSVNSNWVCSGTTTGSLPYFNSYSADMYSIDWVPTANTAGLIDVPFTAFPGGAAQSTGNLPLTNLISTPGTYAFSVTFKTSSTGCTFSYFGSNLTIRPSPTITLGVNPAVCSGPTSTTLSYSATTNTPNQYSIHWNSGLTDVTNAGLPASPITISGLPTVSTSTAYTGTLSVKNTSTTCQSSGVPISVTINAVPAVSSATAVSICTGVTSSSLNYTGAVGSPNEYSIDWASGITDVGWTTLPANTIPISGVPAGAATYTGTLYLRNTSTGCAGTGNAISLAVSAYPTITVSPAVNFCPGQSATLTASGAGTGGTYTWSPSTALNTTSGSSVVASPTSPITYTVTGTNSTGCSATNTVWVNVTMYSQTISFGGLPGKTYGDGAFGISASASSGQTVTFGSSNPSVASISGNMVYINGAGSTTITAYQGGNSCFYAASPVSQTLNVAKADQVVYFNPPGNMCGAATSLSASTSSGLSNFYFASSNPEQIYVTGNMAYPTYGAAYIQAYEPGNQNYNQAWSISRYVIAGSAYGSISQGCSLSACGYVYLYAGSGSDWYWDDGNWGQARYVTSPGTYSVTYMANGCQVSASIYVEGCNNCEQVRLAADHNDPKAPVDDVNHVFGVSPNPASDQITITLSKVALEDSPISIRDLSGKQVLKGTIEKGRREKQFPTSDLPAGLYLVIIQDAKQERYRKLVIVR